MLNIKVINGDINKALSQLKRKVSKTKQMDKLRNRKTYIKPTTKKRILKNDAIYKNGKDVVD